MTQNSLSNATSDRARLGHEPQWCDRNLGRFSGDARPAVNEMGVRHLHRIETLFAEQSRQGGRRVVDVVLTAA